ncbi:MAG: hypothetical protein M1826_005465 [Phylliscum demangeonii]|nr:MAG: hypothetical protein M1826_005465 [Phylliscum demangeonii]
MASSASPASREEDDRQLLSVAGILFDLDGTLIDSTDAIVKHWHKIAKELHVDPNVILATSHGRRSIDTLGMYDPTKANWEYVSRVEGTIPTEFGADAKEVAGARALLDALERAGAPWAIATSGSRALVQGWMKVLRLPRPRSLVTAEDVEQGKPHPACYQLARARLGLAADAPTLVVEDAPAGIRAAKAAGCTVVALTTTHSAQAVREAGADHVVRDLRDVVFRGRRGPESGEVLVEIRNVLGPGA